MSLKAIKRNKHDDQPDMHSFIFPVVQRRKSTFIAVEFETRILSLLRSNDPSKFARAYCLAMSDFNGRIRLDYV